MNLLDDHSLEVVSLWHVEKEGMVGSEDGIEFRHHENHVMNRL